MEKFKKSLKINLIIYGVIGMTNKLFSIHILGL